MADFQMLQDGTREKCRTVRLTLAQNDQLEKLRHEAFMSAEEFIRCGVGLVSGLCRVCACTDASGCPEGCTWANEAMTLCSSCAAYLADHDQWQTVGMAKAGPDG